MADASGSDDKKLHDLFMDAWNLYEELDKTALSFNSAEYQGKVQKSMQHLEHVTRTVSQIGMFSSNELIDEVSTDCLQYLLLPFLLGKLSLKLNSKDRSNVLEVAEVYLKDYLQRCQEYELCDAPKEQLAEATTGNTNELAELMRAANARNDKIAQFRRKKELEEQIKVMRDSVRNQTIDDESKREFFLNFLKKSIIDATEELQSLQLEKKMVEIRKTQASSGSSIENTGANDGRPQTHAHGHHKHSYGGAEQPKPLQPFIITRNAAQKAVFGMGYPSLPIMTVDEFYTQRVQDGVFPDEEKSARMNQAQAIAAARDPNEKEDEEKAIVEMQEETDDPEYLARMQRMDEYKDVVRRGDGNRYNRS